jgi:electron transport complex protein RnfB
MEIKAESKLADLATLTKHTEPAELEAKRTVIEAALVRARARRGEAG